jgi:hypothetical protein
MENDMFITYKEYSKMLYFEPKGPSCTECHGIDGRISQKIKYISHINKKIPTIEQMEIKPINNMKYRDFERKMKSRLTFMPFYNLTDGEIKALYSYLTRYSKNNKK